MNWTHLFTLESNDLVTLGADRAVEFFRRLLWAEAARAGIGQHLINVPSCINVGDGGIDAYIENATPSSDEVIPRGTTGFQVKASDLSPEQCKKELHIDNKLSSPIKPEIVRILKSRGTYGLVLFTTLAKPSYTRRLNAIRDELRRMGYKKPEVRLYTADHLVGFAERFISVVGLLKPHLEQCAPYASWAQYRECKSPRLFVPDAERARWIDDVRNQLRNPGSECLIVRVIGLSGVGKTRTVFEALSPDDLQNRVIYVKATAFRGSTLYTTLQNNDHLSAIIVIDECDLSDHDEFAKAFSGRGSRLAVFTISHDIGRAAPPARVFRLNPLGTEAITEILQAEAPQLPDMVTRRLTRFADGYPRIASLLAESYVSRGGSSDEFITVSDDVLMSRLISGGSKYPEQLIRKVLTGLSLFRKMGYEGAVAGEAEWAAKFIKVDWDDFVAVIEEQRQRGIVQGQFYLYVAPFMLRVHLLSEWWAVHGFSKESFEDFIGSIPDGFRASLVERFLEHIPYITSTVRGREFANTVLGEHGFFADGRLLRSEVGADFFLRLAEADPDMALRCLQRTIGTWTSDELLQFTTGRRQVVWALERIAVWKELFADAARLLLRLGETENETWSNNASGVFVGLFSPGTGQLAPTEVPLSERIQILQEALGAHSKPLRMLGLRACERALETQFISRTIGAEWQGLRKEPELWMPKTRGEIFEAYRQVWTVLRDRLVKMSEDEHQKGAEILLHRARSLGRIPALSNLVFDTLDDIAKEPKAQRRKMLAEVLNVLRYEGPQLPQDLRERWENLRDTLTGRGFAAHLRRYVGMSLFIDTVDDKQSPDSAISHIEELARQAIREKALLIPELRWLVTTEAENGYQFGYALGREDHRFSLLPELVAAQQDADRNASVFFLSGYFHAVFEQTPEEWERQLDRFATNDRLCGWIPELTWRSGMSERAALRIAQLAESGKISPDHFQVFAYGGVVQGVTEAIFQRWIGFLVNTNDVNSVLIALSLTYFYYNVGGERPTLPEESTLELLTHPSLFQPRDVKSRSSMTDFVWDELAGAFVQLYPALSLKLAEVMIENLGKSGTIVEGLNGGVRSVLNMIAQQHPQDVWALTTKYLGPPIDSRAFHLNDWLRGASFFEQTAVGALEMFPPDGIWKWVDEDIDTRAWYLASFVPKRLFRKKGKLCLAREALVRYGERNDVRRNLMANFSTGGWTGPMSVHLENRKRDLLDFKKDETNDTVRRWIDEYVTIIEGEIQREKIEEEREL